MKSIYLRFMVGTKMTFTVYFYKFLFKIDYVNLNLIRLEVVKECRGKKGGRERENKRRVVGRTVFVTNSSRQCIETREVKSRGCDMMYRENNPLPPQHKLGREGKREEEING